MCSQTVFVQCWYPHKVHKLSLHILIQQIKFPLAAMGVLATGSAHARPSALPPIDTSGNVSVNLSASFSDQLSRQIIEF